MCSLRPLAGSKATQVRQPGSTRPSRSRYEAYNSSSCLPLHASARRLWCKLWLKPSGSQARASGPEAAEVGAETMTPTTTTATATTPTWAAPLRQRRQRRRLLQLGHHGARPCQKMGIGVGISQKAAHIPTTRIVDTIHRAVATSGVSLGDMQGALRRRSCLHCCLRRHRRHLRRHRHHPHHSHHIRHHRRLYRLHRRRHCLRRRLHVLRLLHRLLRRHIFIHLHLPHLLHRSHTLHRFHLLCGPRRRRNLHRRLRRPRRFVLCPWHTPH